MVLFVDHGRDIGPPQEGLNLLGAVVGADLQLDHGPAGAKPHSNNRKSYRRHGPVHCRLYGGRCRRDCSALRASIGRGAEVVTALIAETHPPVPPRRAAPP